MSRTKNTYQRLFRKIEDFRQRLAALTPGPWFAANMTGQCWELFQDCETRNRPLCRPRDNPNAEMDLRFVAASPMLIAWLCDELELALKELKAAQVAPDGHALMLADEQRPEVRIGGSTVENAIRLEKPKPTRTPEHDEGDGGGCWDNAVRTVEDQRAV